MKTTKLIILMLVVLAILFVVDVIIKHGTTIPLPSLSIIMLSLQMLVFMKMRIEQGDILFAFVLFLGSMFCQISTFANVYSKMGFYDATGAISYDRFDAIYLSVVTWTTLGYGDFSPTESVRLFAAFESLVGYIYLGIFVAFTINWLFLSNLYKNKENASNKDNSADAKSRAADTRR